MAHSEHNRSKKSGGFFLILLGALLFFLAPIFLMGTNEGFALIILGFIVGGVGFYLKYVRKERRR